MMGAAGHREQYVGGRRAWAERTMCRDDGGREEEVARAQAPLNASCVDVAQQLQSGAGNSAKCSIEQIFRKHTFLLIMLMANFATNLLAAQHENIYSKSQILPDCAPEVIYGFVL